MNLDHALSKEIVAYAESFPGIRAGIARLSDVLESFSYQTDPEERGEPAELNDAQAVDWPPDARSVLVLGLAHPLKEARLDWWKNGNTQGNRKLMEVSQSVADWLGKAHGRKALPLPYHLERGGLFLKDAGVLAGLGIVGKSNLFLHPEWGPRIRLRSLLIQGDLLPAEMLKDFSPCDACKSLCHKACPVEAFPDGKYSRAKCGKQIKTDARNRVPDGESSLVKYCRACELVCPAGR